MKFTLVLENNNKIVVQVEPQMKIKSFLRYCSTHFKTHPTMEMWRAMGSNLSHCPIHKTFKQLEITEGDTCYIKRPIVFQWMLTIHQNDTALFTIQMNQSVTVTRLVDAIESQGVNVDALMDGFCDLLEYSGCTLRELGSPTKLIVE